MERYEKLRVIGQGAFGKVFLVRRRTDESQVVIKQIPVDDLGKDERLSALNEVKVLSMLKHPNIIAYYDNFVDQKSLMIVMEYAPGATLHEFIQERNHVLLDEDHILLFFVQLLVAIEHVHLLNILHRDLKTQNVMMNGKRNILKIGDFGISKVLSSKITSAQTVVGTPCYISPEICEGKMYATKSDIWALGCILYELTTLRKAFEGPNLPALVLKIMQASAVLEPIDSKYSPSLYNLIYSMLQRNPDDRPGIHSTMATPIIVNAHTNLSTGIGRLPCTKIDTATGRPMTCTRMNSRGGLMQHPYLVEPYMPPGGLTLAQRSPKPVTYIWGGSIAVPMRVEPPVALTDSKMASVACGRIQRLGVTDDGKLMNWEVSEEVLVTTRFTTVGGGKGRKKEPLSLEPIMIGGLKTTAIKKVSCGDMFTACLTDKGILMTFGSGANGSLGHGDCSDVAEPKLVQAMLEFETTEVSCGAYHVIAITSEGSVYAWGKGDRGQLGLGSHDRYHTPKRVCMPPSASVPVLACCGSDCSVIVTNSGQVFSTGSNKYNKLTLNNRATDEATNHSSKASAESSFPDIKSSSLGSLEDGTPAILKLIQNPNRMNQSFIMASMQKDRGQGHVGGSSKAATATTTTTTTTMMGFGVGSLGGGLSSSSHRLTWRVNEVSTFTLTRSELIQDKNVIFVAMGINHTAFLTASGEVLTCGDNNYSQLGYRRDPPPPDGSSHSEVLPQVVTALQDVEITKISCGDFFCITSCKDGTLYSWGRGRGSRLGRDTEEDVSSPQKIPFEFPSHHVQSLNSSHGFTMLVTIPQS